MSSFPQEFFEPSIRMCFWCGQNRLMLFSASICNDCPSIERYARERSALKGLANQALISANDDFKDIQVKTKE